MQSIANCPAAALWRRGVECLADLRLAQARSLFEAAWEEAGSPLERVVGAHYLARAQPDARSALQWDIRAFREAEPITGTRELFIRLPSMYLGCAESFARTGDREPAIAMYRAAAEIVDALDTRAGPDLEGSVWWPVRAAIFAGLQALGYRASGASSELDDLLTSLDRSHPTGPVAALDAARVANTGSSVSVRRQADALRGLVDARTSVKLTDDEVDLAREAFQTATTALANATADTPAGADDDRGDVELQL